MAFFSEVLFCTGLFLLRSSRNEIAIFVPKIPRNGTTDSSESQSAVGTQFSSYAGRQAVVRVGSVVFVVLSDRKSLGSQQRSRDGRVM